MTFRARALVGVAVLAWAVGSPHSSRAQVLETETARSPRAGTFEFGSAFEFQTSAEGTELAVPLAVEYGWTDRLSLLVEPVIYTSIRPTIGPQATDFGDLEATGFFRLRDERGGYPAVAVAAEVKFATSENPLISTGMTDGSGYLIASKRLGQFDVHANLGYTIFGQPPGATLNNIFSGALAAEFHAHRRLLIFGEMLGNTSSTPEGGGDQPGNPNVVVPEAAGGELVGTLGLGVLPTDRFMVSLGLSYDNNHAWLIRPGLTYRMR